MARSAQQGVLAYQYEEERRASGLTGLAGLPAYLDLMCVSGLNRVIAQRLNIRTQGQGWTDAEVVSSVVLLNLAGGDCVEDLRKLEGDDGFCRVLLKLDKYGMNRKERRAYERRWRKGRERAVPSPSALFRYLASFHDESQEKDREPHTAFIPKPNEHLRALWAANADFVAFVQSRSPKKEATLDMDATLVETHKKAALHCYKGYKAYQPLNVYWYEQDLVVHSEFRDGNVPAGYQNRRVLEEALGMIPAGVEKVYLRTDTAGYDHDLLQYCAEGKHERFGVIEFAVGVDVTAAFREAVAQLKEKDWNALGTNGQQWAEVCFVPNWAGYKKNGPQYRFLAIREPLREPELPGLEQAQQELPFPTMDFEGIGRHKLFGVVTNRTLAGEELIQWHRSRCGKSEEAHSVMKEDLAGGKLPSEDFGANAAWWAMMLLAYNLNSAMKRLVLGGNWATKRLKAIRYPLINLAGRVLEGGRQLVIRLAGEHPSNELLLGARARIMALAGVPPGG